MAAYLKSGAFKKALYVLRTQCTAVERRADWCFEEAYALYRLGRFQDCLGLIGSLSEEIQAEKSFQMLLAQTVKTFLHSFNSHYIALSSWLLSDLSRCLFKSL